MKFKDVNFSREHRFAIGIEEESKQYYISFPASNGMVDYDEYYQISEEEYAHFKSDLANALDLLKRCKERKEEARLMYQPSLNRGSPS